MRRDWNQSTEYSNILHIQTSSVYNRAPGNSPPHTHTRLGRVREHRSWFQGACLRSSRVFAVISGSLGCQHARADLILVLFYYNLSIYAHPHICVNTHGRIHVSYPRFPFSLIPGWHRSSSESCPPAFDRGSITPQLQLTGCSSLVANLKNILTKNIIYSSNVKWKKTNGTNVKKLIKMFVENSIKIDVHILIYNKKLSNNVHLISSLEVLMLNKVKFYFIT